MLRNITLIIFAMLMLIGCSCDFAESAPLLEGTLTAGGTTSNDSFDAKSSDEESSSQRVESSSKAIQTGGSN